MLSRQPRDLTFRIEMFRLPAEFAPRPGAAQLLVERKTPRPFAEFGRDRVDGNDLWRLTRRAKAFCKSARDATDRKPLDGRADIAGSGGRPLKREHVELCEVFAVHQRPVYWGVYSQRRDVGFSAQSVHYRF